jgi:hypothetical protein
LRSEFEIDFAWGDTMLTVSHTAGERLSEMLAKHPDHIAARIVRRNGQLKLQRGTERPNDKSFQHAGRTVLLLGPKTTKHLSRKHLVVRDTDNGPKLRVCRVEPKAQSRADAV